VRRDKKSWRKELEKKAFYKFEFILRGEYNYE